LFFRLLYVQGLFSQCILRHFKYGENKELGILSVRCELAAELDIVPD